MKIAVAQVACSLGDVEANIAKVNDFSRQARDAGAALVVFPEVTDTGYAMPVIQTSARPWSEGAVPELRKTARRFSIAIVCGVSERESGSIYNSQVFIDANGEIAGSYRKIHLFRGKPVGEDECFSPGHELKSLPFGDFRAGLSICYDLRFPELYRILAIEEGVNLFLLSSAWPYPRLEHFRILAAARAIENQSYMAVSNRVGTDDGVVCCGSSMIIDPYGIFLASASTDREELILADVTLETISAVRGRMAVFDQRRPDVYGNR